MQNIVRKFKSATVNVVKMFFHVEMFLLPTALLHASEWQALEKDDNSRGM